MGAVDTARKSIFRFAIRVCRAGRSPPEAIASARRIFRQIWAARRGRRALHKAKLISLWTLRLGLTKYPLDLIM